MEFWNGNHIFEGINPGERMRSIYNDDVDSFSKLARVGMCSIYSTMVVQRDIMD